MPKVMSVYGLVGRVTASASLSSSVAATFLTSRRWMSRLNMKISYSSQVTSHLPIQNGAISTSCCGPSSSPRPASPSGLPIRNLPPGIGTMSNVTSVPASVSVYFFISAVVASAAGLATGGGPAGASADSAILCTLQYQPPSATRHAAARLQLVQTAPIDLHYSFGSLFPRARN